MANIKIDKIEINDTYGKYEIYPLERGFGNTFGTPLRRILLSSIKGFSVSKIKVKGVDHEFSNLKGMKEDVLRVVLNLQKVVFTIEGSESEKVVLKVKGAGVITAGDIKVPGNVTIINPDFVIAELTDKAASIDLEAEIESGYGLVIADDEIRNSEPGSIPVNKNFSPVVKVNVSVEATRVAQKTDFDKIVLEIWTNGAVSPDKALKQSVTKLFDGVTELNELVQNLEA